MERYCPKCFTELPEKANYCPTCGKCMRETITYESNYFGKECTKEVVTGFSDLAIHI